MTKPGTDPKEVLENLMLEIGMMSDGGYGSSVRTPRETPTHFRDSVICLNHGKTENLEPCDLCWLSEFIPTEFQNRELPCHFIPLNDKGDTLNSLRAAGDEDRLREVVLDWLRRTAVKVNHEIKGLK